jgi:hypothetical protein
VGERTTIAGAARRIEPRNRIMSRSLLVAGVVVVLALGACEKKSGAPATPPGGSGATAPAGSPSVFDSARNQVGGAVDKAAAALKEGRDQAVAASKTTLDDLKLKGEELRGKAPALSGDSKAAFDRAMAEFEDHVKTAHGKLEELRAAGADKWKDVSAAVESAVAKAGAALKTAGDKAAGK